MMLKAKRICSFAFTRPMVRWIFNPFSRDMAIIFMLHRFNDPDNGVTGGHEPEFLDNALSWLKKEGFKFESLSNFINSGNEESAGSVKRVIFTLDDGYRDQLSIAGPIFFRHECPATVFLITDFIDGLIWAWDDKVEYILKNTDREKIDVTIKGNNIKLDMRRENLQEVVSQAREFCKRSPGGQLGEFIEALSHEARVDLPEEAPREYQPLSWEMVREWEKKGIRFGSHGRDHKILSTLMDEEVAAQLDTSLKRLKNEIKHPEKTFCYPTGRYGRDFGQREIHQVQNSEYNSAISSDNGYAHINAFDEAEKFRMRRFAFPNRMEDLIQYCSGLELFKDRVRQLVRLTK